MRFPALLAILNQARTPRGPALRVFSTTTQPHDATKHTLHSSETKTSHDNSPSPALTPEQKPPDADPIGIYFARFAGPPYNIVYDTTKTYAEQYAALKKLWKDGELKWKRKDPRFDEEHKLYAAAVNASFEAKMVQLGGPGGEGQLGILHTICTTLGIDPIPATKRDCRKVSLANSVTLCDLETSC